MSAKKILNGRIVTQGNEHNPPHVHFVSPDSRAQVSLIEIEVMEGALPRGKEQETLNFIEDNRDSLIEEFYEKNPLLRRS